MRKTYNTILAALCGGLLLAAGIAQANDTTPAASSIATPAATSSAATASKAATSGEVARAQFTSEIQNHEPTDDVTTLDNSHTKIYFFTDLKNMSGQTVTHRWSFNGNTVAEVKLEPKAARWRTYSSKTLDPVMTGTWSVEVVDGAGNVLAKKSFEYTKAASMAPAANSTGGSR
ncbi:MAG TPA: DUF2914 domain-containing protein [Gammaproteobacteria bacterium]|nr:DUF2914 domain-containing protein [Gammaproteobacteria bacterium]